MNNNSIILASNSPRRKDLLALGNLPFDVLPADVDERVLPNEAPRDYVARVAFSKARVVADSLRSGWVLAADTTVVLDGRILGKPHEARTARQMLRDLRGRSHDVFTGLTIINAATGEQLSDLAASRVPMRDYSDEEMETYIASDDPLDKAGAKEQIAKELKMHPFRAQKLAAQCHKFDLSTLERIYQKLNSYDLQIKRGEIQPKLAMDFIVAAISA